MKSRVRVKLPGVLEAGYFLKIAKIYIFAMSKEMIEDS